MANYVVALFLALVSTTLAYPVFDEEYVPVRVVREAYPGHHYHGHGGFGGHHGGFGGHHGGYYPGQYGGGGFYPGGGFGNSYSNANAQASAGSIGGGFGPGGFGPGGFGGFGGGGSFSQAQAQAQASSGSFGKK